MEDTDRTEQHGGVFDRIAAVSAKHVSRAWFFIVCTLSVVIWALTGPIFGFSEVWQLVINTGTTIITFLLVALLQNSAERESLAQTHKMDAMMLALALLLEDHDDPEECQRKLKELAGVEMEASK